MEIKVGEVLFLDTNVLLSATDESRPSHAGAQCILRYASQGERHFAISGQVVREYLVVATRPVNANGLGLDTGSAVGNIDKIRKRTVFFDETESVSAVLQDMVADYSIEGKRIHDANVAATMLANNISKLITENGSDFTPFDEIETVNIAEVARLLELV